MKRGPGCPISTGRRRSDRAPHLISEGVADYFYRIDPQYQTPQRNAYEGRAGFLGNEVTLAIKYSFGNKNIIVGAQFANFSQSANRGSYLHRSDVNWSFVLGLGWILYQSEVRGKKITNVPVTSIRT